MSEENHCEKRLEEIRETIRKHCSDKNFQKKIQENLKEDYRKLKESLRL